MASCNMVIKAGTKAVKLTAPYPEPDLLIDADELEKHVNATVARVIVTLKDGRRGLAFLSAKIKPNGRLEFSLTTKKGKDSRKETIVTAEASWCDPVREA